MGDIPKSVAKGHVPVVSFPQAFSIGLGAQTYPAHWDEKFGGGGLSPPLPPGSRGTDDI